MDKSLGTNLHLWRFFTRAKQTVRRKFIYTCSAPPPPPSTMLDKYTRSISLVLFLSFLSVMQNCLCNCALLVYQCAKAKR